jgi:hypothetical protein
MPDDPKPTGVPLSSIINGCLVAVLAILTWNQKWAFDRITKDNEQASEERALMWDRFEKMRATNDQMLVEIRGGRKDVQRVQQTAADTQKAVADVKKAVDQP